MNLELARLSAHKDERGGAKDLGVSLSHFLPFLQHGKLDKVHLLLTVITHGKSEKKTTQEHNVAQAAPTTDLGN